MTVVGQLAVVEDFVDFGHFAVDSENFVGHSVGFECFVGYGHSLDFRHCPVAEPVDVLEQFVADTPADGVAVAVESDEVGSAVVMVEFEAAVEVGVAAVLEVFAVEAVAVVVIVAVVILTSK